MTRDFQRSAVYSAQHTVDALLDDSYNCPTVRLAGSAICLPMERKFADIPSMQRYVQAIAPEVQVRPGRPNQRKALGGPAYGISIPTRATRYHMRETSLLHELAHVLNTTGDRHGPAFCSTFLLLIAQQMGPEAHFLFQVQFLEAGVRIN